MTINSDVEPVESRSARLVGTDALALDNYGPFMLSVGAGKDRGLGRPVSGENGANPWPGEAKDRFALHHRARLRSGG